MCEGPGVGRSLTGPRGERTSEWQVGHCKGKASLYEEGARAGARAGGLGRAFAFYPKGDVSIRKCDLMETHHAFPNYSHKHPVPTPQRAPIRARLCTKKFTCVIQV